MLKLKLFILVMIIIALPSCKKQDNKKWGSYDTSTFMHNNNELKVLVGFWEKNKINSIVFYGNNKSKDFEVFFSPEGKLLVYMEYIDGLPFNGYQIEEAESNFYLVTYSKGKIVSKILRPSAKNTPTKE